MMDTSEPIDSSDIQPSQSASSISNKTRQNHAGIAEDELKNKLAEIFSEAECLDAKRVLDTGGYVITAKQFRLLEWAERQLRIRRLEEECEGILEELAHDELASVKN